MFLTPIRKSRNNSSSILFISEYRPINGLSKLNLIFFLTWICMQIRMNINIKEMLGQYPVDIIKGPEVKAIGSIRAIFAANQPAGN